MIIESKDIVKLVSKNEILWTTYFDIDSKIIFFMTSNHNRDKYFLYKILDNDTVQKVKTSIEPLFDNYIYGE